ncbi:hypothetical protein GCM10027290_40170 [Micromonospora sonneratiae]|uniref:DUF5709 domain-containing protein n=1 Tax=Micromonospora sonneratiae TaxID=1184706 RepID=A0ABW3YEI8_9ACTN
MTQPDEEFAPGDHLVPEERDLEASADDVAEQTIVADPAEDEPVVHRGLEVAEWDALEQARIIGPEDDYR